MDMHFKNCDISLSLLRTLGPGWSRYNICGSLDAHQLTRYVSICVLNQKNALSSLLLHPPSSLLQADQANIFRDINTSFAIEGCQGGQASGLVYPSK